MINNFHFSQKLNKLHRQAIKISNEKTQEFFHNSTINTGKVLQAFRNQRVSESDFKTTTGYGYNDYGRDKLDKIWAEICKAEAAIYRTQFVSGTHALSTVLYGILRPGDELVSLTGTPYDTILKVIGVDSTIGSLLEFSIKYNEVNCILEKSLDLNIIKKELKNRKIKMVFVQRSRGYSSRRSLSISEIEKICLTVKKISPDTIIFVDNCYGEFTEEKEPIEIGADIIAGSLLKNPGGGLVNCGGYISGKKHLVDLAANRLTAPGLGSHVGASLFDNKYMYQGLFMAPHSVFQALRSICYAAALFNLAEFHTNPWYNERRCDIIQSIALKTAKNVKAFCKGLQKYSPVDSFVIPEPWDIPGYCDKIIMAAGTFVQGSSIEISADAPMKSPYILFLQGGIIFEHSIIAILGALEEIINLNR